MEIISTAPDIFGRIVVIVFAITALVFLIYEFIKEVFDKDVVPLLVLGAVFLCTACMLIPIYACAFTKSYRLRVDDKTTVKELKETYDIIKYDPDVDLWIVKEKKINDDKK